MKYQHINPSKVYEASISEPVVYDSENPFCNPHGWQVLLTVGFQYDGLVNRIVIDRESEGDCKKIIDSLGFIQI